MRTLRTVALLLVVVLTAACSGQAPVGTGPAATNAPAGPIRIASLLSLTGAQGVNGVVFKQGAEAAVKHINANGGINGRSLEIQFFDNQTRPEQAVALAQQIAGDPTFLACLCLTSSGDRPAEVELNKEQMPTVALFGSEDSSTDPGPWSFHQAVTFDRYSLAIMRFIRDDLKLTKLGLIWEPSVYGASFEKTIKSNISQFAPLTLAAAEGVPLNAPDTTIQIQKVLNAGAQVLVLGTSSTNAVPVNNWAALGSPVPIIGGIGLSNPLQVRGAEDAGKKVSAIIAYFTGDDPLPRQREMVEAYKKSEGTIPQYQHGASWDGVQMLATVFRSGADTRAKVRDGLETQFTKWEGTAGIYTFSKTSHQGYDPAGLIFVQYLGDGRYKRWSK